MLLSNLRSSFFIDRQGLTTIYSASVSVSLYRDFEETSLIVFSFQMALYFQVYMDQLCKTQRQEANKTL